MNNRLLKILLLVSILGPFIGAAVVRSHIHKTNFESVHWAAQRSSEMLKAWQFAIEPKTDLIGFFGTSEVESGIWPTFIDAKLREAGLHTSSLNLATRISNSAQTIIIRKIRDQALSAKVRFRLSFLKFNVSRNSTRYRQNPLMQSYKTHLEIPAVLESQNRIERLLKNPSWLAMATEKYLEVSTDSSNIFFLSLRDYLLDRPSWSPFPSQSLERERLISAQFMWRDPSINPFPAWNPQQKGEFRWGLPGSYNSFQKYETLLSEDLTRAALKGYYDYCCGISNPSFDKEMLSRFSEDLRNLKLISDQVIVLYFEDSPELSYDSKLIHEIDETLKTVAEKSKTLLWNYKSSEFLNRTDYLDWGHLNQQGAKIMSERLAKDIANHLTSSPK